MRYEDFVADWSSRFVKKTCTINQLERLVKINKLKQEDFEVIISQEQGGD